MNLHRHAASNTATACDSRNRPPNGERGVILISALVLVALAAVVAAALFFDTGMLARRAAASNAMEQALQLGQAAEGLAASVLVEDGRTGNNIDAPNEIWARPAGPYEVGPEVMLEAQLLDLQGRFNLNTLVKSDDTVDVNARKVFLRLLQLLEIDARYADLLVDWIDANAQVAQDGGEDTLYLSQEPQHRAANLALTSTSELLQLPGFTREMYLRLAPHVTALPPSARTINVCTADGYVLDALYAVSQRDPTHVEYSAMTSEDLASRRAQGCFPRSATLTDQDPSLDAEMLGETSGWFRLQSWIRIGTAQFALYSLMYRHDGQVRPVARSLGTE